MMIFPPVLAKLGDFACDCAMQHRSVSRPVGWPTLNLLRKSLNVRVRYDPYRLRNAANGCLVA